MTPVQAAIQPGVVEAVPQTLHRERPRVFALSPDGKSLATETYGDVRFWRVMENGETQLWRTFSPLLRAEALQFTPDSRSVLVCTPTQIEKRDFASGARLAVFAIMPGAKPLFTLESKIVGLVVGTLQSNAPDLLLLDAQTLSVVARKKWPTTWKIQTRFSASLSPDATRLAVSDGGVATLFEIPTDSQELRLLAKLGDASAALENSKWASFFWSPNSQILLVNRFNRWDSFESSTGKLLGGPGESWDFVAWSADSQTLLAHQSSGPGKGYLLFNPDGSPANGWDTGIRSQTVLPLEKRALERRASAIAQNLRGSGEVVDITSDGQNVTFALGGALISESEAAPLRNARLDFKTWSWQALPANGFDLEWSPDAQLLAARTAQGVTIWRGAEKVDQVAEEVAGQMRWSPDSRSLGFFESGVRPRWRDFQNHVWNATPSSYGDSKAFGLDDKNQIWFFDFPSGEARGFGPDGKRAQTIGFARRPNLGWNRGEPETLIPLEFSPDSQTVALGAAQNELAFYDLKSGKRLTFASLRGLNLLGLGPLPKMQGRSFSRDGKRFVAADENGILAVWEVVSGRELRRFRFDGRFNEAVFADQEGAQIWTENKRGSASLWDVSSGQLRGTLWVWPHKTGLDWAFITPDSRVKLGENSRERVLFRVGSELVSPSQQPARLLPPDSNGAK